MRALSEHLEAINSFLPALHDGFFIESYDGSAERLVILGTSDISYRRDLVITCTSPLEVRFAPVFRADAVRLTKEVSGQQVLEMLEDGKVMLSVRGGVFSFECAHV